MLFDRSDGSKVELEFRCVLHSCSFLLCRLLSEHLMQFAVILAILWIVQDELYDTLPIIIRSPVLYLQVILTDGIVFIFLVGEQYRTDLQLAKIALRTAFHPELWRPYAEKEAIDARARVTPTECVSIV